MTVTKQVLLNALLLAGVRSDMYLHWPRGHNNRLNEASANRNNANRIMDSQNNNRGGYNVGDMDPVNGFNGDDYIASFTEMYNFEFLADENDMTKQYEMLFFEESSISVTWTSQHGAGNKKLNSMFVLQYICDTFPRRTAANNANNGGGPESAVSGNYRTLRRHGLRVELDNGGNTNTPDAPNAAGNNNNNQNQYENNNSNDRGRREAEEYYALCQARSRNDGLFHADQNLQGTSQIYTRQNPGGTRRGLECPEERDYFPWWNPSPFHDIAVITPDVDYCESMIAPYSQNVMEKWQCLAAETTSNDEDDWLPSTEQAAANLDETACNAAGGSWESFKWDGDEPECVDSFWAKVNHLGNVDSTKRGGKMAHYDWTLPSYDSLVNDHWCHAYEESVANTNSDSSVDKASVDLNCVRMQFRIRYNMSTMDYDPYQTNSSMDEDNNQGVISPIENNPTVDVGIYAQGLRLAINTAQTGRVFQDNTHSFLVCERPSMDWDDKWLLNVGVRGKRGNIVQTFPAIEYDFEPQHIFMEPGQCMHFQWTGSNTHNNGAPGGDGQTGDAGEGRGGSDRSTLVQSLRLDQSYPVAYDTLDEGDSFFDAVDCYHPLYSDDAISSDDASLVLGTAGFYRSVNDIQTNIDSKDNGFLQELLNNASASFRQGLICCVKDGADDMEYNFISTRNNNFTNRSQKLKIIVSDNPEDQNLW